MTAELALTVEQTAATTVTRRAVGLLRPTIGIVVVSVLCFVVLVGGFTDVGLVDAARAFVSGALGSVDAVSETLTRAVPLAIVGVGAALGLRAGVFNVGGESQMIMGAVAAVIVTGWVGGSAPVGVVWAVAAVAALAGGALWAVVPAVLWVARGVSEILSTLLINFVTVALLAWLLTNTWLQDPDPYVITAQGAPLADRVVLPVLIGGSRIHAGAFVALVAVAGTAWTMRTGLGYRIDLVGANPSLAAQAGIRPVRLRVAMLLASAALAGLAGAVQLFGVSYRLSTGLTGGVGYTGVLIAVLGRGRPIATGVAAIVFAILITGGESLEREGVPRTLSAVIQAVLIVGVALALSGSRPRERWDLIRGSSTGPGGRHDCRSEVVGSRPSRLRPAHVKPDRSLSREQVRRSGQRHRDRSNAGSHERAGLGRVLGGRAGRRAAPRPTGGRRRLGRAAR